jgi:lipopolysaccharide/colanic/teichoic acid biosynthesis glycosyltransferase
MSFYEAFGKRAFDIFFSFVGIYLCSPFFLTLFFLIKLDSNGSVFFIQKRMGLGGRLYPLIKFRTMYHNYLKEKLLYEPGRLERITPLGKILRKTKFDELPQLINILRGEMSFVGPRPEVSTYRNFYSGKYEKILNRKPGITGIASMKYRNEEALLSKMDEPQKFYEENILPDKLKIELEYAEKRATFKEDIKIILKTLKQIWFI